VVGGGWWVLLVVIAMVVVIMYCDAMNCAMHGCKHLFHTSYRVATLHPDDESCASTAGASDDAELS
jgi:hypothetical protein